MNTKLEVQRLNANSIPSVQTKSYPNIITSITESI